MQHFTVVRYGIRTVFLPLLRYTARTVTVPPYIRYRTGAWAQHEFCEPLNLNVDILEDLITGRVVRYLSNGLAALEAMFREISWPAGNSSALAGRMEGFKRTHTFDVPDFRPPTFRWDNPSIFVPTAAIPVQLKRKGDEDIEEEKKPAKRATTSKETKKN
ncbi:hypothetical protein DFH08DRAFT_825419 [Mycena albidolilacea]|uniref:Uncharacterized protein n=1 Tax=Mycena albidolilacea TaxID=1033008 RepID=A0AAD7E9F3_9AGAR|nr:hypothetical protein DFH08DRAFT_825419 [Mycena albidolilacea]